MDSTEVDLLVKQLVAGFGALQEEYKNLYGQHQALEKKLVTAREQYNEIARMYGSGQTSTPPLSLSSSPGRHHDDTFESTTILDILDQRIDPESNETTEKIKAAIRVSDILRNGILRLADGVKIWSGPSADQQEGSSCMMPSITESPLEQDFTVEGKPSKLGCPFASMTKKKLSSHAASVLSRYNQSASGTHGSVGAASTPFSNTSRINGLDTLSQRRSRRTSFADPIKAEICGLSDHGSPDESVEKPAKPPTAKPENGEVGVCPIRFLDQHSPEEVATYFEKHKHELPRNHEVCVMRYQSNEEQIRELDAKYGNLVSMIQGLGKTHKAMLPQDPEDGVDDGLSDAKVRKWASSVSAQAPETGAEDESEARQPHFERPLRDIRVGESPSRPWGIPVPAKYLDKAPSDTSSRPAQLAGPAASDAPEVEPEADHAQPRLAGKCPFSHGAAAAGMPNPHQTFEAGNPKDNDMPDHLDSSRSAPQPDEEPKVEAHVLPATAHDEAKPSQPRMTFTGPVFIGYSAEEAAKILSGLKMNA